MRSFRGWRQAINAFGGITGRGPGGGSTWGEPIVRGAALLAGTLGEAPVSVVGAPKGRTIAEGVSTARRSTRRGSRLHGRGTM